MAKLSTPHANGAADYPVGYGKPPKASQFQKGQSGNPGGASRKVRARKADTSASPFDQIILKAAGRKIAINENGVRSEITTHEAVVRKLAISAAKGERSAQKHYFDQVQSAIERQHKEKMARFGLLAQYVNEHGAGQRRMAVPCETPPLPHPDDVVLNYVDCVGEVVGPIDAHQAQPLVALVDDYRTWQARQVHLQTMAMLADRDTQEMRAMAIGTIASLLSMIQHRLPPSLKAQLEWDGATISSAALEIPDPNGGTINLAMLSVEGGDMLYALALVNAWAANFEREIGRRPKLNIAANTTSLINRLQIERQNRDGGAPPAAAVPEFGQFYDDFASEAEGIIFKASP